MIVREADAEILPSYATYAVGEKVFRPIVNALGGYAVHGVEQLRPLDGQSYIVASNHRSNWDSFVIGLALVDLPDLTRDSELGPLEPRALHFMAKDTLWRWPVVKQFVERCGAFKVKRGQGVGLNDGQIDHITNLVDHDAVLGIYPQGKRIRGPEDEESLDPEKFKTTIAYLALKYGLPIVPAGIAGPVKGPKFPRTLLFDEPIHSGKMDPEDEAFNPAKYALMEQLHGRINASYQQARQLHQRPETSPAI